MGSSLLVLGLLTLLFLLRWEEPDFVSLQAIGLGSICGGILNLLIFYYEKKRPYLRMEEGFLYKDGLFPKKIELSEVETVKHFAGEYTFIGSAGKLNIDTQYIEQPYRRQFEQAIKQAKLPVKP